jgi:decaprenylphospho-beta-D-erythro-pentofuranosid-2-ulose 2-reductase
MNDQAPLIVAAGALSAIAVETLRLFASHGRYEFLLLARKAQELELLAQDLKTRGALKVSIEVGDMTDDAFQTRHIRELSQRATPIHLVFVAWGLLADEQQAQSDPSASELVIRSNFVSVANYLTRLVPIFEQQKSGTIAVISSVAGDRGRQSNYVYGSSKAGLTAYLQGYRNRLYRSGVQVLTIKPGIVKSPMTSHLKHGVLSAEATVVGNAIFQGINRGADVIYAPRLWWVIMTIIKLIPETIFKRLRL